MDGGRPYTTNTIELVQVKPAWYNGQYGHASEVQMRIGDRTFSQRGADTEKYDPVAAAFRSIDVIVGEATGQQILRDWTIRCNEEDKGHAKVYLQKPGEDYIAIGRSERKHNMPYVNAFVNAINEALKYEN